MTALLLDRQGLVVCLIKIWVVDIDLAAEVESGFGDTDLGVEKDFLQLAGLEILRGSREFVIDNPVEL